MLAWIAITALSLAPAQDAGPHDPTKELAELVAKTARVDSYAFESVIETEREGSGGAGGEGRGGGEPQSVSGIFKRGLPMQLRSGELLAYKDGEFVVTQNADGKWELIDGQAGFGRGGRGGMRALFGLMRISAPHHQLAELTTLAASCERRSVTATEASPERTIYAGKLTEAGAKELGERGGGGFRGGRGGDGGGPELTYEGTYEIEVTQGVITAVKVEITRSGAFGENSFVLTTTQKTTLGAIGAAQLEVPTDALALFEV